MAVSLAWIAEHYRARSAADPDADRRGLWLAMADNIDDYLAFDDAPGEDTLAFDGVDDEDPQPWSRARPS